MFSEEKIQEDCMYGSCQSSLEKVKKAIEEGKSLLEQNDTTSRPVAGMS